MVFTDAGFSRVISKFRLSASRGGRERVRAHAFNICKLAVAVAVAVYSRARACVRVCVRVYTLPVIPMYTSADRRGAGFVR